MWVGMKRCGGPFRKGDTMYRRIWWVWLLGVFLTCHTAFAYDGLVEKKVFEMPSYTTVGGRTIKMVRMGYESYGKLNGDNAILIAPFFGGTSHAAGKYKADDPSPGYWDTLIGPDRPLDTNKFFASTDSPTPILKRIRRSPLARPRLTRTPANATV